MARRRRGSRGRRRGGWFGRGKRNPSRQHSLMNIFAALASILGITVPMFTAAKYRWDQGLGWQGALSGAGDMLMVLFTGRNMDGTESQSSYKYMGWWSIAAGAGILIVNRLVRTFAGRIKIWGRWTLN